VGVVIIYFTPLLYMEFTLDKVASDQIRSDQIRSDQSFGSCNSLSLYFKFLSINSILDLPLSIEVKIAGEWR
jgi:hypothetical protein